MKQCKDFEDAFLADCEDCDEVCKYRKSNAGCSWVALIPVVVLMFILFYLGSLL
jgi:hypothetical protein